MFLVDKTGELLHFERGHFWTKMGASFESEVLLFYLDLDSIFCGLVTVTSVSGARLESDDE